MYSLPLEYIVIGINHKHASIAVREQFSLSETEQQYLLSELKSLPEIIEAFVLSTCNRVEIYAHQLTGCSLEEVLIQQIFTVKKIPFQASLHKHFYCHRGEQAIRHLLRVATGLDSLILGEKQILGQIKEATILAQAKGLFQRDFNILANTAIRTGKKAHTQTTIGFGGSSVSWAAVAMAENFLGSLSGKSILILGAGKMSEMAVKQIANKSPRKIYLMNRTQTTAMDMAQKYGAQSVGFYDILPVLQDVDICICATGAPHYILEEDMLQRVMQHRAHHPVLLIDISVPRNIDPGVVKISGVQLYTIDDLDKVVQSSQAIRASAVDAVECIIEDKLKDFQKKLRKKSIDQVPLFPASHEQ
jgi:glutamyl-tRNA reductase